MSYSGWLKEHGINTVEDIKNLSKAQIELLCEGLSSEGTFYMNLYIQVAEAKQSNPTVEALLEDGSTAKVETKIEDIVRFTLPVLNKPLDLAPPDLAPLPSKIAPSFTTTSKDTERDEFEEYITECLAELVRSGHLDGVVGSYMDLEEPSITLTVREQISRATLNSYSSEIRSKCGGLDSFKIWVEIVGPSVSLVKYYPPRFCRCNIM